MSGPRHPGTEGNDLWPADVKFPDPDGGDGRLSLVNDVAADFSGLAISSTHPTDMPDGGLWVNLSADPTGIDRVQTYDESTDAFIPISADRTIVSEQEPEPEIGLLWFEPVDDGANLYAANSDRWEFLQFIPSIPDSEGYLYNESELEDFWTEGHVQEDNLSWSRSKEDDHLFIHVHGGDDSPNTWAIWSVTEEVDLSQYSQLEVEWEVNHTDTGGQGMEILYLDDPEKSFDNSDDREDRRLTDSGRGTDGRETETASIDVSGNYHLAFSAYDHFDRDVDAQMYQLRLIE